MLNKLAGAIFLLFFIACNGNACHNRQERLLSVMIDSFCHQKLELRDSLYVNYTMKVWRDSDFYAWGNLQKYVRMKNDEIEHYVSCVFYSPDRLKAIFCAGEKMPNAYDSVCKDTVIDRIAPNAADTIYSLYALLAYRDHVNDPWTICSPWQRLVSCYNTGEQAYRELMHYLFVEHKNISMFHSVQTGKNKGKTEGIPFGYNIQDKDFWSKCWLWEKDSVMSEKGLYPFQEYDGYFKRIFNKDSGKYITVEFMKDLEYPKIDYPKEILDMYYK